MRITSIFYVIVLLSLYSTIINAAPATSAVPTLEKRQETEQDPDFNTNIFKSFKPLDITASPITREYTLTLAKTELAPDGFSRQVWTSNGQYPGPMIRANKGDQIVIHIQNNLGDFTTIHWHGIFQRGTTFYDGVAGQTQCLIATGTTFTYNFTGGEQYGTYWWHSHFRSQYVDGLRGALIIHDPKDPYLNDYDEEFVMTLSDWHHEESESLVKKRMAPGYDGFNPIPDSGLISGRGRCDCSKAPQGSKCVPDNPLAVYVIEKGKRYRFRVINTSAEAPFTFSIDQHPLRIIEVEGENVKPITMNKINIAVGQRYSVIVNADKEVNNFWIRATIVKQCIHVTPETINVNSSLNYKVTGILRYNGAPETYPTTQEWDEKILNCRDVDHNLLKLNPPRSPPVTPTDNFTLKITFDHINDVVHALVNGSPFNPEIYDPTANKLMYGGDETPSMLDKDQNAFVYDTQNGSVEISLINDNIATHPFHLHGHNFYIMAHGPGKVPDPSIFNLVDPAVRDTITVAGKSWAVIRYNIDNPGVWAFHCHIEWHVEMGMVGQLIERFSELKGDPIPPQVRSICTLDDDDDDDDDKKDNNNTAKKRSLKAYKNYYKRSDVPNHSRHVKYQFIRGSAY
ncbi:Fet3p [Rhizophagus irregularis DAOM 197198w]|uniref:Fet3p n=1 Tax=Rhizophagus irregularis (strain DAOM 197198w) TaxID=1432141 RepID=A0A015J6T9_RHIIW|nr:Fet3p [Rhizophagus irregularis DAOM 197198w]